MRRGLVFVVGLCWAAVGWSGEELVFSSGAERVQLVELYTSQGCSSCPPAERKLNGLLESEGLWREVVPVAFHVDYWDRLGWRDPFASKAYTNRQYAMREASLLGSVYTPCFVVSGKEWRGYFAGEAWPKSAGVGGELVARVRDGKIWVEYEGGVEAEVQLAVVGVGLATEVKRGENRGRRLEQEFVALWLGEGKLGEGIALPEPDELAEAERYGLAVWVVKEGELGALQAAGGWWK